MDALLQLGKGSWQRYESGGQIPGSQVIARVTALGYSANWRLMGTGPMQLKQSGAGQVAESPISYERGAIDPDILREVLEVVEPCLADLKPAARADLIVELARWAQSQRDRERSDVLDELKKEIDTGQHRKEEDR